jgi:murein L,D-transpeptidase YafK
MTNKYLLKIILITQLTLLFGYVNLGYASDNNLQKINYMKIVKSKRKLYTYSNQRLIKTYKIALGRNPIGHKKIAGDKKTPEGLYQITEKNPNSAYHLSLKISYPSKIDIQNAENSSINLGDNIMIHGIRNGFGLVGKYHNLIDWTKGCIAVSNEEIEEIYNAASIGTKIEILP